MFACADLVGMNAGAELVEHTAHRGVVRIQRASQTRLVAFLDGTDLPDAFVCVCVFVCTVCVCLSIGMCVR